MTIHGKTHFKGAEPFKGGKSADFTRGCTISFDELSFRCGIISFKMFFSSFVMYLTTTLSPTLNFVIGFSN